MRTVASQEVFRSATTEGLDSSAVPKQKVRIAGGSGAWRKLLIQAEMAAPHLLTATVEGEQGSGKQTLARYLHACSPLAPLPFHRHPAREWPATISSTGTIEGFIYLDRVDLLSPSEQAILAEALKTSRSFPPNRACIVASSRTSLRQLERQGSLGSELLFHLAAVRFVVPPLRFRREDIAPLVHFLLERACERYRHSGLSLGHGTLARLMQYTWPGNVRELAGVIEAALLKAKNGVIRIEDLEIPTCEIRSEQFNAGCNPNLDLHHVILRHVRQVLDLNNGNKLRAARQLGISRSTLYRILGNEAVLGR